MKTYSAARATLEVLCATQPGDASFWSLLADACMRGEKWERALAALDRTIALAPGDAGTHQRRLRCYAKLNLFQAALAEARWIAENNNTEGRIAVARVYAIQNTKGSRLLAVQSLETLKVNEASLKRLAEDPDFATLRSDPKFKKLTGE